MNHERAGGSLVWTAPQPASMCQDEVVRTHQREPSMTMVARLGIDTSKSLFQLHGVDDKEGVVLRKQVRRGQFLASIAKLAPTEIGLEACGASHYWARQLQALGHKVR